MKKARINLHIELKRTLLTWVFFSLISILVMLLVNISIKGEYSQLRALFKSEYEYSAVIKEPFGQDDFIKYNAGIYFSVFNDAQYSLNVDVIMQLEDTVYSDKVFWKAKKLDNREVAITKNVAASNGIEVGDVLFSKHIVDGSLQAYRVAEILPEATNIRMSNIKSYTNGIVIMGFDPDYYRNISNGNLVYTEKPINELASVYPEDIIYREDEIQSLIKQILPYWVVSVIGGIILCIGMCVVISKQIEKNFLRQLMLGFSQSSLNSSYWQFVCLKSIISVIISFLILITGMFIFNMNEIAFISVLVAFLLDIIAVIVTSFVLLKKLWRR